MGLNRIKILKITNVFIKYETQLLACTNGLYRGCSVFTGPTMIFRPKRDLFDLLLFCIFIPETHSALLHALLNRTDGSTPAIIHCVAWLICVLLQVQRCQDGAACFTLASRGNINPSASVISSEPTGAARKLLFGPFSISSLGYIYSLFQSAVIRQAEWA